MRHDATIKRVAHVFGLKSLRTGPHTIKDDDGNVIRTNRVSRLWCAEISYFHPADYLVIAVTEFESERLGLLAILPAHFYDEQFEQFLESIVMRAVVIPESWQDPVFDALKCVDLSHRNPDAIIGRKAYQYLLMTDTQTVSANLSCSISHNPELENLWKALLKAVYFLVDLYADEEMRRFVDLKPRDWYFDPRRE